MQIAKINRDNYFSKSKHKPISCGAGAAIWSPGVGSSDASKW